LKKFALGIDLCEDCSGGVISEIDSKPFYEQVDVQFTMFALEG